MKQTDTIKPMVCKLTSPELRKRKEEVIDKLRQKTLERKELSNGFAYRFDGSDEMLDYLNSFIKTERLCCDFFDFSIQLKNNRELWLQISGQQGVKEFIKEELGM